LPASVINSHIDNVFARATRTLNFIWRNMLDVLQQRFDVHDAALNWFTSYFADRTLVVVSGDDSLLVSELRIGAPKGVIMQIMQIFHTQQRTSIALKWYIVEQPGL